MAGKTRVYFATDLHGSSKCFRKFLNAGPVYGADVMILGGDLAGKAIQSIVRQPGGSYRCNFIGTDYEVADGPDLEAIEKLIADHGYYPYRAEPGELEARKEAGTLDDLFLELMNARLEGWLALADERLRPQRKRLLFMLGNDDPPALARLLDSAPWGEHDEGKIVWLDDDHEMISWGFSNRTPWNSYREQDEPAIGASLARMAAGLAHPERSVVNVHVPPFDTQLDDAPVLDDKLQVQQVLGQVKMAPVGSTAVCDFLTERQPLLGLHGHIHESSGIRRLGRTIAINPGSDYSTGTLNGALITLEKDKVSAHQLVRG
ncbi:MAG: metallophosphoesterase [Candidatus Limnocylindrales bacterium]